ncbi:MAG: serine/threonine-protein kinase [Polyangiales bacterium]
MTRTTVRLDDDEPAAPAPGARVGDVIAGRYRLARVLGGGGMGTVYEATHTFTHRRVAVKLVHRALAAEPRAESRLAREARALALFDHPGIVAVLDGGRDADGTLYLVETLLDGEDLAKALAAGAVSPGELAVVAAETLDALAAAHARGLVHRDIKPENIFLAREPGGRRRVKLVDFGIVRATEGSDAPPLAQTGEQPTQTGSVVGTPRFMSPEQARGESVDARTDLWSLGAVMFFALTGRHAIEADNYNALIVRLATTAAPPVASLRPDVPAALAAVVDRALARDLDARWPTAAAMADALRPLLPAAPRDEARASLPPAPTSTPAPTAPPTPTAPPATTRTAAALALGLSVGAALAVGLRPSPRAPVAPSPVMVAPSPRPPSLDAAAPTDVASPHARPDVADAVVDAPPDAPPPDAAPPRTDAGRTLDAGPEAAVRVGPRRPPRDEPIRQMTE